MSDDTRHLARTVGAETFAYREIASEEEQAAAAARWPLLASVNRQLAIGARPARPVTRELEAAAPRLVVRSASSEGR